MFNKSVVQTKTQIASLIFACALAVISFSSLATVAGAQQNPAENTLSALQAQIALLMAQIAALQGGGTTTPPPTSSPAKVFAVGASVQPTANIRVRTQPGLTSPIIGTENISSRGIVSAGPVKEGGYNWYKVDFKAGFSGWVTGWWLQAATANLDQYNCVPGTSCPGSVLDSNLQPSVKEISSIAQKDSRFAGSKGISIIGSFEVEITAQDSPLYVNPNTFNIFPSVGEKSSATDNPMLSKTVTSNAQKSGVYYFVGEGESRTFKVTYEYFPREKGTYVMIMQNFDFAITAVGRPFTHELYPNRPQSNEVLYFSEPTTFPYVTITNITSGLMPIISGNTEERVTTLGLSIAGPSGDKVYGSGVIPVTKGKWSHIVGTALPNGINEVVVYADKKEVARKKFNVGEPVPVVKPTPRFNGVTYPVGTSVAAVSAVFASPKTPSTGPVIIGYIKWGEAGTATQTVSAIPAGTQTTVELKHTYKTAGDYLITLIGLDGKLVTQKVTVTLPPVAVAQPTCTLTATPANIRAGQPVTLTWTTTNVKTASINNSIGVVAPKGTKIVTPGKTTTYQLLAVSATGVAVTCVKSVAVLAMTTAAASSTGLVKGAATVDHLAEIQVTLTNIQKILSELE